MTRRNFYYFLALAAIGLSAFSLADHSDDKSKALLKALKKAGLATAKWVEQESGIPRKYYLLTEEGRSTLITMQEYWSGLESSIKKITNNEI